MRLREPEMPLDPEIERELAAIDGALAGLEVEPELEELAQLARETRNLRDTPEPEFATNLDERLAEEFPHEGRLAHPRARIAATPPRRILLPAGSVATLLVAVSVGISQLGQSSGGGGVEPMPVTATRGGANAPAAKDQLGQTNATRNAEHGSVTGGSGRQSPSEAAPLGRDLKGLTPVVPSGGGLVPNHSARKIESSAQLTLAAGSDQVPDVADGVVDVTHRHDGIVVSSQVTHSDDGAHASFDLAIPSAQLQAALADLSDLAHVQSSSEGSIDITAPTVHARRRIAALEARLAHLRGQLAAAIARGDTPGEGVIKQKIAYVQSVLKRARNSSAELRKRADIARVSLTVSSDGTAVGGGAWTLDDAFHDAGRVLTVTAGVLLVTAAVLGPVTVLAALAWATSQALLRWRRERSLDQPSQG